MPIPIVNEDDEIIAHQERDAITPQDIFRSSAVWITDKDEYILLAKRSVTKLNYPGAWGSAVAGVVEEGESYEECAYREAEEEIGLFGFEFVPAGKMRVHHGHPTFASIFRVVVPRDYEFVMQVEEVEELKWFSRTELVDFFTKYPEEFVPSFGETLTHFKLV